MPQEDDSRLRCDVLSAWASITQEKQRRQANRRRAVRFHYFKLLRQGFEAFRYPIQTQQERIQVLNRVSEKKLQARCFYAWLQHVRTRQVQARQELQARQNQLQLAFYQWKALHLKRIQDERDERTTAHFHRNKLIHAFFIRWKAFVKSRHHLLARVEISFKSHEVQDHQALQLTCFQQWREHTQSRVAQRFIIHRAQTHYELALTKRVFQAWVQFVGIRMWEEMIYLRAAKHRMQVILRHCFIGWREKVHVWKQARAQTTMALTHWKMTMQRRAMKAWIQGVHIRQAKRHFRHEALEWRHALFLRQGLAHWIQAAFVLQEERMKEVQRRAALASDLLWRRIARIASHWQYVAVNHLIKGPRGPRQTHEHMTYPTPARNISFHDIVQPLGMSSVVVTSAPRRPQPRKPLELLYDGDPKQSPRSSKLDPVHIEPLVPEKEIPPKITDTGISKYGIQIPPPRPISPKAVDQDLESLVDDMEARLQYWHEKKTEWKRHKHQLDELRLHLSSKTLPKSTREVLQRTLEVMEATHRDHLAAHAASKAEMKSFAHQIEVLKSKRRNVN
ncbi:hypothetical protein AeNC1_002432 [Aphanomyces euteiches]|nr:hypothetical protein AeNC1_002432 [Aphanomyces euteiches]